MTQIKVKNKPTVTSILQRLGIERARERNKYACVFCGSPDGFHNYGETFYCFSCERAGDSLSLYMQSQDVSFRTACNDLGIETETETDTQRRRSKPTGKRTPDKPLPDIGRAYRDTNEVLQFWESCSSVWYDQECRDYLTSRSINAGAVVDLDLARVLPSTGAPWWASCERISWQESGHRLVVPLYDPAGYMRSVIGRDVTRKHNIKSLSAIGPRAGLVFADSTTLDILRGENPSYSQVAVVEGEIDFLTLATIQGTDEGLIAPDRWAVMGVFGGSWTWALTNRLQPDKVSILIETDKSGMNKRKKIKSYLEATCKK